MRTSKITVLIGLCLLVGCATLEKVDKALDDADKIAATGEAIARLAGKDEAADKIADARSDIREVRDIAERVERVATSIESVNADPYTNVKVRKGDMLSTIAEDFYGDWRLWTLICSSSTLVDCHCLTPGKTVRVPIILKWSQPRKLRELPVLTNRAYNEPPYVSAYCGPDRVTP